MCLCSSPCISKIINGGIKMKTTIKSKNQKIKVRAGEPIQIEINCRVYKECQDGVELIVEGYPEIKLGANKECHTYTITELNSGMAVFTCSESENYLQLVINKINSILEIIKTDQYLKQVERLKILPTKYDWLKMWEELETILQLNDLQRYTTGRLSQNVLELGLLENEIYLNNRTGQQSSENFFNGKSCKTYILDNYGARTIELIERLSSR